MVGDWLDEAAAHLSPGSGLKQAINAAKEGKVNSLPRTADMIKVGAVVIETRDYCRILFALSS